MYLKGPTILYHADLARDGKLFNGSESHPLPHPGKGWVDTPAKFHDHVEPATTLDDVLADQRKNMATDEQNARLREQLSDADELVKLASDKLSEAEQALITEKNAHAATQKKLDDAGDDLRRLEDRAKAAEAEADKVEGLSAALAQAQSDNAALTEKIEAAAKAAKAPAKA